MFGVEIQSDPARLQQSGDDLQRPPRVGQVLQHVAHRDHAVAAIAEVVTEQVAEQELGAEGPDPGLERRVDLQGLGLVAVLDGRPAQQAAAGPDVEKRTTGPHPVEPADDRGGPGQLLVGPPDEVGRRRLGQGLGQRSRRGPGVGVAVAARPAADPAADRVDRQRDRLGRQAVDHADDLAVGLAADRAGRDRLRRVLPGEDRQSVWCVLRGEPRRQARVGGDGAAVVLPGGLEVAAEVGELAEPVGGQARQIAEVEQRPVAGLGLVEPAGGQGAVGGGQGLGGAGGIGDRRRRPGGRRCRRRTTARPAVGSGGRRPGRRRRGSRRGGRSPRGRGRGGRGRGRARRAPARPGRNRGRRRGRPASGSRPRRRGPARGRARPGCAAPCGPGCPGCRPPPGRGRRASGSAR